MQKHFVGRILLGLILSFAVMEMNAQDFAANPPQKEGYFLEFQDEFNEQDLNTNRWVPYYLPHWSSRAKSKTNYAISGNLLQLKIDEDQAPWCPEFNGEVKVSSLQTGLFAGKLNSTVGQHKVAKNCKVREEQQMEKRYTPKYGYFEIRAKALAGNNNVCAFWMIGFEDEPHKSAEICIMEVKGENVQKGTAINGHGLRAFQDQTLQDEFFEEESEFDATKFHIYAAEWRPDRIDFYLDNQKVRTVHQSPTYEMQFMLNIYEVPTIRKLNAAASIYPKNFEVDYVRAYQPVNGY